MKLNAINCSIALVLFFITTGFSQESSKTDDNDYKITKGRYYSSLTFSLN